MNNTKRDVTYNVCMPKLKNAGWEEGATTNLVDERGVRYDAQTTYVNKRKNNRVHINKKSRTIEVANPIKFEEAYWFSSIGTTGGFEEDEWSL